MEWIFTPTGSRGKRSLPFLWWTRWFWSLVFGIVLILRLYLYGNYLSSPVLSLVT